MNEDISISVPSLIHRIGGDKVKHAKVIAGEFHCELKRVRRSRNWVLIGQPFHIVDYCAQLKVVSEVDFRHLIKKIDTSLLKHADKLEPLEEKLARLITENPNITLSELVHMTDCTIAEARAARFDSDLW